MNKLIEKINQRITDYFKGKIEVKDGWDIVDFNADIHSIIHEEAKAYNEQNNTDLIKALRCLASQTCEGDCYETSYNMQHIDDENPIRMVCGNRMRDDVICCPFYQDTYGVCFEDGECYWLKEVADLLQAKAYNGSVKGDLICRSDLLKKFCVNSEGRRIPEVDCDNHEITVSIKDVKSIIREQPTAYNGGWIPCSERLPEVEADVLLSLRSLDVYTGFRANTEGCFYVDGEGYTECYNVLAWQPLPEPYKQEGE